MPTDSLSDLTTHLTFRETVPGEDSANCSTTSDPAVLSEANDQTSNGDTINMMRTLSSTQIKTSKRSRELSVDITDTRPAKKNCRLAIGSLSVPKNDSQAYRAELNTHLFYALCPSDKSNIRHAIKGQYVDRVIYGMCGHTVIERLVLDGETRIPWQVPKVTVEFKMINYTSDEQMYSVRSSQDEGKPVNPTTMPGLEQMSRAEYEIAVECGSSSVAAEGKHLFEFCRDADIEWLKYEDR